jgi:hypothetical protein
MDNYIRPVSGQRLGKHVPSAKVTHASGGGEMRCCLRGLRRGVKNKKTGATNQLSSAREAEKLGPEREKLKNLHC